MADDRVSPLILFVLFLCLPFVLTIEASPMELCGAANFAVWNLTSKMWRFQVSGSSCLKPKAAKSTPDSCDVTMAFCQSVNLPKSCSQAAVCESYKSNIDTYNLATYKSGSNPFNTQALFSGVGFKTKYENGEMYTKSDNTTCVLNTVMTFYCNITAVWDSEKPGDILTVPITPSVHLIEGTTQCTYNMTFQFAGACPVTTPSESVTQLSPGTVLLMIFFAALIVYFVLGSFINVARGQSGLSILPHHHFWISLPALIMEGIQFTLTCGRSPSRKTYESI